jgi:hypothetical protein
MIIVTVKMVAEKTPTGGAPTSDSSAPGVNVEMKNTQIGRNYSAALRAGESVEHLLHLYPNGVIELQLLGWGK